MWVYVNVKLCGFGSRMEMGEWKGMEPFSNDPSLDSESIVLKREAVSKHDTENMKTSEHNRRKIWESSKLQ